MRKKLY